MPPEATYYDVTEYWPDEPPVGMKCYTNVVTVVANKI